MKLLIFLLLFCKLLLFNMCCSQSELTQVLKEFTQSTEFQSAGISLLITDLKTGSRIIEHNPYLSLPPASTTKLFSSFAALEILGPEYRPKTRIYREGIIVDSILKGNIWIRGGGDVSLGSRFFQGSGNIGDFIISWVDSLKKQGIKRIEGKIISDGSAFGYGGVPDGWNWGDIGNYYGAGPSGVCVYDNSIRYSFKTGSTAGIATVLTSCFPEVANLNFHNFIRSENVSDDHSYIYGGPFSNDRFGIGSLPLNRSNYVVRGSLPDPEDQLAQEFTKELIRQGIQVSQGSASVRKDHLQKWATYGLGFDLLFTHQGQKMADILKLTNMRSINLFAEGLVCLVGYEKNGNGSTESGLKEIEKYWSNYFDTRGLYLKDGSGLSRSNGISAYHFCEMLKVADKSTLKPFFISSLPVAGRSGTLFNFCRNQAGEGRIVAKSGTMSKIKSFAGYIETKSGNRLAFALILTNFSGTSTNAVSKIEKLLNSLTIK
jgi:D-alanyl-D-alanine carboxypeptidase/D-alanyl-D-alanine-endopeptidase (penicillin-binding protein 4)